MKTVTLFGTVYWMQEGHLFGAPLGATGDPLLHAMFKVDIDEMPVRYLSQVLEGLS